MDEDEGMAFWPMVTVHDIYAKLMFFPSELSSSDLSDYKQCKAYSYFVNGWLNPLLHHQLSGSKFCLIKGTCRPSQNVNDPPHGIWIIFEKTGKIRSSHCTCTNGMSQVCNHIAAALYRMESAVRNGLTNPACTSKANEWLPGSKKISEIPGKIKDLMFVREDFGTRGKKRKNLNGPKKRCFNPLNTDGIRTLQLADIAAALEEISPNSIVHTAVAKDEIDFVVDSPVQAADELMSVGRIILSSVNVHDFLANLFVMMTKENISAIENATQGQSDNETWFECRKNVVTSSKAHDVKTKVEKLKKCSGGYIDMYLLNIKVAGKLFVNPNIPALKYGRAMESEAITKFINELSEAHKGVSVKPCGLMLDKDYAYIGTSPDGIVSCSCCENSCLEIKCPYSINHLSPKSVDAVLPYLVRDGEDLHLKRNHKYFTQCQMHMGITGLKRTYFYIWTAHGSSIEIIDFDAEFYHQLKNDIKLYYENYYLKSIYSS